MITILTYVALIAGGILVLMMVLSLFAGLDLDLDLDADADVDDAGYGAVKSVLTFLSIGAWTMRLVLLSNMSIWVAVIIGLIAGFIAVWLLAKLFKLLINNDENVNWQMKNAVYQEGKVYLKIPAEGEGIVQVLVNGVNRELKAKSNNNIDLKTGEKIVVMKIEGDYAMVEPA